MVFKPSCISSNDSAFDSLLWWHEWSPFADNPQPVPMVPLTEENEDAMEDTTFTKFLKKIGLSPPANEQVLNSFSAVLPCVFPFLNNWAWLFSAKGYRGCFNNHLWQTILAIWIAFVNPSANTDLELSLRSLSIWVKSQNHFMIDFSKSLT